MQHSIPFTSRPRRTLVALMLAAAAFGGCASDSGRKKRALDVSDEMTSGYRPGSIRVASDDEEKDGLVVEHEHGVLDQGDVDRALDRHVSALVSCYERAGEAQKFASGQVTLKFVVGRLGAVSDVVVVDSALGNYAVERCLVVEARKIAFPAPRGGKEAEFEYPLNFRSSGEVGVVEWDGVAMTNQIGAQGALLANCGAAPRAVRAVKAVAYVEPGGTVTSVGLASTQPIDPMVGICLVEQIRKWKLPDDKGHVVRTSFALAEAMDGRTVKAASAEPKRVAKRVSRRRSSQR